MASDNDITAILGADWKNKKWHPKIAAITVFGDDTNLLIGPLDAFKTRLSRALGKGHTVFLGDGSASWKTFNLVLNDIGDDDCPSDRFVWDSRGRCKHSVTLHSKGVDGTIIKRRCRPVWRAI